MPAANKVKSEVGALLESLCDSHWDEVFLIDGISDKSLTYGQFFGAALSVRDALATEDVQTGDTLTLALKNRPETLILYTAALMRGVRIALIDPEKGVADMQAIFKQIETKATISDIVSSVFGRQHIPAHALLANINIEHERSQVLSALSQIDGNKEFLVTFTSGSTGHPKGVRHSAQNLVASSLAFGKEFGFGPQHTFYHHLPMTYVAGILNSFFLPLVHSSKIVVGPRFSVREVSRFWDIPSRYSVNVFWLVPTMLSLLQKLDRGDAGKAYVARTDILGLVGTAPLGTTLHREFEERYKLPLFESYGLSETLFVSTQSPKNDSPIGSVGSVLSGAMIDFSADHELLIDVPWMFRGYIKGKEEETFDDKKFVSGDLGKLENGSLFIVGRKKDIIIRGGVNVSPRRIEEYLHERMVFEENVVMGFPDDIMGERIVCFFVPHPGGFNTVDKSALLSDMREKLGKESLVDEFFELNNIPKNTNGKVDAPLLRARYKTK